MFQLSNLQRLRFKCNDTQTEQNCHWYNLNVTDCVVRSISKESEHLKGTPTWYVFGAHFPFAHALTLQLCVMSRFKLHFSIHCLSIIWTRSYLRTHDPWNERTCSIHPLISSITIFSWDEENKNHFKVQQSGRHWNHAVNFHVTTRTYYKHNWRFVERILNFLYNILIA